MLIRCRSLRLSTHASHAILWKQLQYPIRRIRLLRYNDADEFTLTKDLIGDDVPRYAILSHTWGADTEEVNFKDMMDGTGKSKQGYHKIQFCAEQARRDNLQYFWVDTCCIDKSNSTELSEAINSMFQWYRNAARCYVYLADVSKVDLGLNGKPSQVPWEDTFRKSRWFTRGWTLQELIAPTLVEFFSRDGIKLGDKESLGRWTSEITGIPIRALQAGNLSNFSIAERLSWQRSRNTSRSEDKAYSLLGICGVYMPLIYGEGKDNAYKRLREEIEKASKGAKRENFSVPFSLSDVSEVGKFVGRQEELAEMHQALSGDGSRRISVLSGLGGIGKTQLAAAYAKQYKDSYSAIFWLNTRDEDALKQSFTKIARRIIREYPSASRLSNIGNKEEDLAEIVDAVKAWLSLPGNTRWLMIFDNYDNPKVPTNMDPAAIDLRGFLPESYQGSVIITTRSSQVVMGNATRITKLENIHDSLQILLNASGRQGLLDDPGAMELAKELDGFPLALATARAYLRQVSMSCSDYLRLYNASWLKLQKLSPRLSSYEDRTLYSTWQISYDRVEQQNKLSAMLLRFWAYFDNHDLWFELLRHSNSDDPEWIRELTQDELSFHSAVSVLTDHGVVEADNPSQKQIESRGYSMHSCVHSWTTHVLNQEWDADLAKLSLKFVASHVPDRETPEWWLTQRRLLHHATRCTDMLLHGSIADDTMLREYYNLGIFYINMNRHDEAGKMFQRALAGMERAWGLEHTSTLDTINNLAILYAGLDRHDEAQEMYQRALVGYEKAWGLEHMSTLNTINNLGALYANTGRYDEAEKMYQRALAGKEKVWGLEHISTLDTIHNLGILYANLGRHDEAEKMYRRAQAGYEKTWGLEHTSTLDTIYNLGRLYADLDRHDEAEKMYQRALEGFEKAWGLEHTSTLNTIDNLGRLCTNLGRHDDAEKMYQRALVGMEKAYGSEHTSILNTVSNLGYLYAAMGRHDEAEKMYQRALIGMERAWGPEHTSTLDTINNLGTLCAGLDRHDEAQELYQRALVGYEKACGLEHKSTLNTIDNLAKLYADTGGHDKAEKMYQRALAVKEKAWGLEHTSTVDTINHLGILYVDLGRHDEAEKMYQRALAGKEMAWGLENASTLDIINNLGNLYAHLRRHDEAEKMYHRALAGYEKAWGLEHTSTLSTINNLGILYANLARHEEAEKMYHRALTGKENAWGPNCASTIDTINKLGDLISESGQA